MIVNGYETMQKIIKMTDDLLTTEIIIELQQNIKKNFDDLEGHVIHFTGTVNVASQNGVVGLNIGNSSINPDVMFVEYDKDEFLKRNEVDVYGYVKGIRNLEKANSVGGSDILEQVPNIEGIIISCTSC